MLKRRSDEATKRRRGRRTRRGMALVDVIVGSVMLGIGLSVVLSVTSRALAVQADGEKRLEAAWLVDGLLTMVLVEGPVMYPRLYYLNGRFETPFDAFEYEIDIEDLGLRQPFRVTVTVRWPGGRGYREVVGQTYITERLGDPLEPRAPFEPIDRMGRYYEDEDAR